MMEEFNVNRAEEQSRFLNELALDLRLNQRAQEEHQNCLNIKETLFEDAYAPPAHRENYVTQGNDPTIVNAQSIAIANANNQLDALDLTLDFQEHKLPSNMKVRITNIVCAYNLGCPVELAHIMKKALHAEHKMHQVFMRLRIRKPTAMATIWRTGKVSVMGTTSKVDARIAARRVARIVQKFGYPVFMHNYRIVNVVASVTMPWAIKLPWFTMANHLDCSFEPELINCCNYHMADPKSFFFIFSNGSITFNARSVPLLRKAVLKLYRQLRAFSTPRNAEQKRTIRKKAMQRNYRKALLKLSQK